MAELISLQVQKNKLLLNRIAPELITDGNTLQYDNQIISIANLDLFFLLQSNPLFYQCVNMQELQIKDIFSIIKIHALRNGIQMEQSLTLEDENNNKQQELIQQKNPHTENDSIFYSQNGTLKEEDSLIELIPYTDFKKLVRKKTEYTEKENNAVQLYFCFIDDLIYYEDYLIPDLVLFLNDYRQFCETLALSQNEKIERNPHEKEACSRLLQAIENKAIHRNTSKEETKDNVKKLIQRLPEDYLGNTGSSGTLFVVLLVILIVVILASITLAFIA